ncbi:hypothetical protein ACVIJ6_005575 [Bradyrhizobium sp. USDA 4369]
MCRPIAVVFGAFAALSGCAIVPDVPPDYALPVQEILQHTSCELQRAFNAIASESAYKRFQPDRWLVTIALTPKVDTDANAAGGFTRKNPWIGSPTRFVNWNVSGPGLQLNLKGSKTSGINFTFKSNELMVDETLVCPASLSAHALTLPLGLDPV